MRNMIFVAIASRRALAGCSSTPTTDAPVDDKSPRARPAPAARTTGGAARRRRHRLTHRRPARRGSPLRRIPNNILSKRSVYFDYDSFVVKDEYKPLVEAHAQATCSRTAARR